jgi:hypothetical protein
MTEVSQQVEAPGSDSGAWPRLLTAPSRLGLLRAVEEAGSEFGEAVALLRVCGVTDCLSYPVGVIDRLLLQVHRAVLHRDLEMVVACPACGVLNALPLGPADVPAYEPRSAWCGPGAGMREPTGEDLIGLPEDAEAAAQELELRCRIGPSTGPRDEDALGRAEQSLCGIVRAPCTECGASISEAIDVQRLVTAAVASAVAEVDLEVHLLASRYGWDLATIESLPDNRRGRLAALAGSGI